MRTIKSSPPPSKAISIIGLLKIELARPEAVLAVVPGLAVELVAGLPVKADVTLAANGAAWPKKLPICESQDGLTAEMPPEPPVLVVITGDVAAAAVGFRAALVSKGDELPTM